ncbi:MAG: pentapeptide repeat-containing protein [Acidimicrobiales bacterium]
MQVLGVGVAQADGRVVLGYGVQASARLFLQHVCHGQSLLRFPCRPSCPRCGHLSHASFSHASFSHASFSHASFSHASFSHASLSHASAGLSRRLQHRRELAPP